MMETKFVEGGGINEGSDWRSDRDCVRVRSRRRVLFIQIH
jgi:hypothetical protein